MQIELHIIQNFAPSNLNRDDTGSPKDCEFGGYRRARISSQALKRAMRRQFREGKLLPPERLAQRTKRLVEAITTRLEAAGKQPAAAQAAVETALRSVGLEVVAPRGGTDDGAVYPKTQYLLFLGEAEIAGVAETCLREWDALVSTQAPAADGRGTGRAAKQAGRSALPAVGAALGAVLNGGKAADLALFGRMLADLPDRNIDAASQVAHAISTHQVSVDFDYYTAVDDLKPEDTAGADMIGTVEFNSACFYRYANLDVKQLRENLDEDADLTRRTVQAFLRAAVDAIPTGKQNSMAAQNPPSLVMTVARRAGLWSLANAFIKPVRPDRDSDLVAASVRALDEYWDRLTGMYGQEESGVRGVWVATTEPDALSTLAPFARTKVASVIEETVAAAFDGGAA